MLIPDSPFPPPTKLFFLFTSWGHLFLWKLWTVLSKEFDWQLVFKLIYIRNPSPGRTQNHSSFQTLICTLHWQHVLYYKTYNTKRKAYSVNFQPMIHLFFSNHLCSGADLGTDFGTFTSASLEKQCAAGIFFAHSSVLSWYKKQR